MVVHLYFSFLIVKMKNNRPYQNYLLLLIIIEDTFTLIDSTSLKSVVVTGKQGELPCWDRKKYDGSPLLFKGDDKVDRIEG